MISKVQNNKFKKNIFAKPDFKKRSFILIMSQLSKSYIAYLKEIYTNDQVEISRKQIKELKIRKYFLSAGIAGAVISNYIHKNDKISINNRADYSLLFGYWAVLLIVLDAYSDKEKNNLEKSITANLSSAKIIMMTILQNGVVMPSEKIKQFDSWINSYNANFAIEDKSPLINTISYFSERLSKLIIRILKKLENENLIIRNICQATDSLMQLMDAQILSFNQSIYKEHYNWDWYFRNVLKRKFDNIFRSILGIFPQNEKEIIKVNNLIDGIETINELFIHRQILDDLIDFEEDIDNGILATPGYILIAFDKNNCNTKDTLCYKIFKKLEKSQNYKRGEFTHFWFTNRALCKEIVIKSNLLNYFVELIEDEHRITKINSRIEDIILSNSELNDCLSIYYSRSVRSYKEFKLKYSL